MGDRAQDMQRFLNCWDSVIENMDDELKPKTKRDVFYRKLSVSKELSEDLAHYRRQKARGEGTENFTYEFLRLSVERFIANDRQDKNLADRQNALRQAARGKQAAELAAAPAAAAPKAKGRGKGKAHSDRSGSEKRTPSPPEKKGGGREKAKLTRTSASSTTWKHEA